MTHSHPQIKKGREFFDLEDRRKVGRSMLHVLQFCFLLRGDARKR